MWSGVRFAAQGFYMPGVWYVKTGFGGADGSLAGYLGNQMLSLAAHVGGSKRWGEYPWFESAAIGGISTVRGYYANRFRGDASLYTGAELRLWLGHHLVPALPVRWGLVGFGDTGRVWLAGESSRRWHSGAGGGVMAHVIALPLTVTAALATGTEGTRFYLQSGYSF
jgi:outer membrane protein assembly factor BamA